MSRLLPLMSLLLCPAVMADDPPVNADIETALVTSQGRIRQFAFDGDPATFFSCEKLAAGDHFTLSLEKPVIVKSIAVATGRPDGSGKLAEGFLQVSEDGKAYQELAKFADGAAKVDLPAGRKIQAVRIQPAKDQDAPLAIGEITIDSDVPIAKFRYPVEFVIDVTDAPEMKGWAEKAAKECERWYPRLNDMLKSDGFRPPSVIRLTMKSSYKGVAEAGGGRITGSVQYFKDHPDDVGAMIHETTHLIQRYRSRNNPGWLVEGVADYIRFFQYEPGKIGPINARRAHYNGSYRTTAAFLAYVTEKYDKQVVAKLNTLMREGKYKEEAFKEITGKTVRELDEEWRATLK